MWAIFPYSMWETKRKLLVHRNKLKLGAYAFLLGCFFCTHSDMFNNPQCVIEMPTRASEIFREPEQCTFCENLTKIDKVENISPEEFHERYATTAAPVVVTDGVKGWPASEAFSFEFFQNLYRTAERKRTTSRRTCQFFPYETDFASLDDVFAMSTARANLVPGERPWYVGWSNCDDDAGTTMRQFYSKPYFLGSNSENIATTWIFMGGPGNGAHMHIDNVHYPSWQAQIKGKKLWKFAPPPECYNICHSMSVLVESGEIIVADTNRWYHQTEIMEGELSITIGSEFD